MEGTKLFTAISKDIYDNEIDEETLEKITPPLEGTPSPT